MNHEVPCHFCGGDTRGLSPEVPGCRSVQQAASCGNCTGEYYGLRPDERLALGVMRGNSLAPPPARPGVEALLAPVREHARRRRWEEEHGARRMLHPAPERPELARHFPAQRIYFAHPMPDYDTAVEARMLDAIVREFGPEFHIVNPNSQEHRDGYAARGDFSYWTDLARGCGTLVYAPLPENWIGSGVWKEVEAALNDRRHVYEIDRLDLRMAVIRHLDVERCLPVDETRRVTHMIRHYREIYGG